MSDVQNTADVPAEKSEHESASEPSFTSEQIAELRSEAKSWRKKLRDAEAQVEALHAQVEELTGERDTAVQEAQTLRGKVELDDLTRQVAAEHGLPVELLRGTTRDELEAHANQLEPVYAKAFGEHIPNVGERPKSNVSELAEFANELFT